MKKTSDTRASLIDHGLKALITSGYDGVGLGAILDAAAVPKGSFYYFFKSKEAFALAVLDAYEQHYVRLRESILGDGSPSPMQRLRDYFDALERIHLSETPLGGCLYGVLAQTVSVRSPEFRAKLVTVFATWDTQLERLLVEAQAVGEIDPRLDPKDVAAFLIEAYEGGVDPHEGGWGRGRTRPFQALCPRPAIGLAAIDGSRTKNPHRAEAHVAEPHALAALPALPLAAYRRAYYLRLIVRDWPGVIAEVTAALRVARVFSQSMPQHGGASVEAVPIVLVTRVTRESARMTALGEIAALPAVLEPPTPIRIGQLRGNMQVHVDSTRERSASCRTSARAKARGD